MPEREAPHGWVALVVTPPPSETFEIARAPAYATVMRKVEEWAGGGIEWATAFEGIAPHGERVHIEPAGRPTRPTERPLRGIRWDDIFETGVIEQWLGPELGLRLGKFGEVVREDREEFEKAWRHLRAQLLDVLTSNSIYSYTVSGGSIYSADVKRVARWFEEKAPTDPRDWSPAVNRNKAMAKALRKMLKDLG